MGELSLPSPRRGRTAHRRADCSVPSQHLWRERGRPSIDPKTLRRSQQDLFFENYEGFVHLLEGLGHEVLTRHPVNDEAWERDRLISPQERIPA